MKLEDYFKYYMQGSDHYLIPKDEFIELFNEMNNWKEEAQKYKEVVDKLNDYIKEYKFATTGFYMHEDRLKNILKEVE